MQVWEKEENEKKGRKDWEIGPILRSSLFFNSDFGDCDAKSTGQVTLRKHLPSYRESNEFGC